MVSGKGLGEGLWQVVSVSLVPSRGSTHLLSSGLQRVETAASDVYCGTFLAELQGDASANTPGSTSHHAHLALHGSYHDSQAKGVAGGNL